MARERGKEKFPDYQCTHIIVEVSRIIKVVELVNVLSAFHLFGPFIVKA